VDDAEVTAADEATAMADIVHTTADVTVVTTTNVKQHNNLWTNIV